MEETELQGVVQAYLQAFAQRDLSRCLDFFAEDATLDFASGVYQGKQAIEGWHKDRFAADVRVLRIDDIRTQGDTVVVDAIATSKRVRVWFVESVAGRVTLVFRQGKITDAKFGLRMTIPLEGW